MEGRVTEDGPTSVGKPAEVVPDSALKLPQGVSGSQKFESSAFAQSIE